MATMAGAGGDDRLVWTLFGATLLHGLVILGISFDYDAPAPLEDTPLKVVMVAPLEDEALPDEAPDDAIYAAARSQHGAGTDAALAAGGIITPATPFDAVGRTGGDDAQEREAADAAVPQEQLVSPAAAERSVTAPPDASDHPDQTRLSARIQHAAPQTTFQRREHLQADDPARELEISVATRQSDVADYMARWKDRIEQVGTLYFPDAARQRGLTGSPLLEVVIGADGGLRSIEVVRPSPHPLLDQAALRILRLAAPFDAFPQALAADYDTLRFVYEWRFVGGALGN